MLTLTLAVLALSGATAQEGDAEARPPITSSSPSRAISARAPTVANVPTHTVCGWERAMGSTIQQRVCRKVPVYSSQRERMSTEYLQQLQSIGLNAENGPNPRQPGGRPVG